MTEKRNIIDFHSLRLDSEAKPPAPLPQLVVATKRTAKYHLKQRLPEFFAQLDDSLFALADKAENNQLQNLYFDTMREVRLKKDAMGDAFHQAFEAGFNAALENGPTAPADHAPTSLDQVTLLGDEELEESLAIGNMASSAEMQYREALYALTARYDFLLDDCEITKDNNPLQPTVICQACSAVVDVLNGELKVRLLVYKLFDTHVVQQLGAMYDAINADLIAAGVLPRIKSPVHKSEAAPAAVTGPATAGVDAGGVIDAASGVETAGPDAQEGDLFAALQQMLNQHRSASGHAPAAAQSGIPGAGSGNGAPLPGGMPAGSATASPGHASLGGTTAGVVYLAPTDIVDALSNLQADVATAGSVAGDVGSGAASAESIKSSLILAAAQQPGTEEQHQLGQADADAIDIVSMLFDFILDDPHIAVSVKSLIARLQIPLLKVAIIDKEFFAKKSHPARQLLNELAYAGAEEELLAEEEETPPVLQMIESVVTRVVEEFADDPDLFAELLAEFTQFIEQEREANRLAEALQLRARERVAEAIRSRIASTSVPPFIRALLIDAWKDVLTHIYLRDDGDEQGTAWQTALKVADDLIWSVQPKLVVSERQNLVRVIPRVLNGLRDGLTLIAYDRAVTEKIFERLEALHLASLRGGVAAAQPGVTAARSVARDEQDTSVPSETSKDADAAEISQGDDFMEEIILASTQAMDWDGWDELESEYGDMLKAMPVGTWVEFVDAETEKRRRGKLTWKCDFTGEYTFVDRKYKVVADLGFRQLLAEFDHGRAQVIEDIPLFDRALDSVISGIKRAMEGRSGDEAALH